MAATAVPAAATLLEPFVDYMLQKLRSIVETPPPTSFDDIRKWLKDELERLLALLRDIENEVWCHIIQKHPSEVYKHWKGRVSNIKEEVASLNARYEEVEDTWNRLKLENEFNRAFHDVIKIFEECPEKILVDYKLPERVKVEPGVQSIEKYLTLKTSLDDIQAWLGTNGVKCVALRGQNGVGKTTIMQNLNNHHFNDDSVDKIFDMVIFIKVAADEKAKDLHILQKIAERIDVDGKGNENEVSGRIQRVLNDKRYLLILDGVRRTIDGIWNKLGIKDKKDSKVVITTCYPMAWKSACVQGVVELKKLSPTEEWQMFRDIVGQ